MTSRKLFIVTIAAAAVLALGVVQGVRAATLRVPEDYKTIGEAVAAAASGDMVAVGNGEYRENVSIAKPLTLASVNGPDAVKITALKAEEPAIKVEGVAGGAVEGFTLTGSGAAGIAVRGSTDLRITRLRAVRNENGIMVYSSARLSIIGNEAHWNEQYGIYLENSHGNVVKDNGADRNGDKGLFLSSSNSNEVTGNSMNLNTWNGIVLWSSHKNVIRNNKALRNTYGIVASDSPDNEMEDNSTWPNLVIILPILLIYIGIASYFIQRTILRAAARRKGK